jgi:hypothetical protein
MTLSALLKHNDWHQRREVRAFVCMPLFGKRVCSQFPLHGGGRRTANPPSLSSSHALPHTHISSAFLVGGHQAGSPATRPVVIPLFRGFWVGGVNIAFTATPPHAPILARRSCSGTAREHRRPNLRRQVYGRRVSAEREAKPLGGAKRSPIGLSAVLGVPGQLTYAQPSCCMLIESFHIFVMCLIRPLSKTMW